MRFALASLFFLLPAAARAHGAGAESEPGLWASWWVAAPLVISGATYLLGSLRLRRMSGKSRAMRLWQGACFGAGWRVLALALLPPLAHLADELFVAHMIEHEMLMVIAAPLLVMAQPLAPMLWALPRTLRARVGRKLGRAIIFLPIRIVAASPLAATVLHGIALWLWHAPRFYEAALTDTKLHWLQHLSFFGTAVLFWWALLYGRGWQGYGASVFYLFATALHTGFLGILLSLSPTPLYPTQGDAAVAWSLTPLDDQQLAGLVMWVPGGLVYAAAALALAALWIDGPVHGFPENMLMAWIRGETMRSAGLLLTIVLVATVLASAVYSAYAWKTAQERRAAAVAVTGGDPDLAPELMTRYGCRGCHTIPGVPGADGRIGPPLRDIGDRAYIGGVLPNTADNLVRWIQNPRSADSRTAMPATGISPAEARHVAAYLYSLR